MQSPLYQPGQTVFVPFSRISGTPSGRYRIVRALPSGGGAVRYRVKGETEACERVIDERVMELQEPSAAPSA